MKILLPSEQLEEMFNLRECFTAQQKKCFYILVIMFTLADLILRTC